MHDTRQPTGEDSRIDSGVLGATMNRTGQAAIDPELLAQTDLCLFRSLRKIGASRERICSALLLSYAEYDDILRFMEASR